MSLRQTFPEIDIRRYSSIDSTNTEAKRLIRAEERLPMLLVADTQTAGRGRLGRSFHSPSGTGLYFTYVFHPETVPFEPAKLTCAAAVALARAIKILTGIESGIKWVNDLYLDGKKIAGILAEGVFSASAEFMAALIGIGLNLSTEVFPPELENKAGSLGVTGIDIDTWLETILGELLPLLCTDDSSVFMAEYRARSTVTGRNITVLKSGSSRQARAVSINDDGSLLVRYSDGSEEALFSGEVSVLTE